MQQTAEFLVAIGGMLLLGLAADAIGRRTFLPRVTLLLILGICIGDGALALIPAGITSRFELIGNVALMMIGFLLGGKLSVDMIRNAGRKLLWISLSASVGTAVFVMLALFVLGLPPGVATLLGCIAAATAPAATLDTVLESGIDNRFSQLLLAIVAVDDAWALLLFSFGLAFVSLLNGAQHAGFAVVDALRDILGALLLGGLLGLPAAFLTGRIRPCRPMLTEALGLVFVCGGAALWFDVSFLLATIAMGMVVTNFASHHEHPFHEIENIERPFLVIFFILAGASLEIEALAGLGFIGAAYIFARTVGKILGAWCGARASHADEEVRRWMGLALLPQAGVAIGMALVAANRFPEYRQVILPIVITSTVFFELTGPVLTRLALRRTR